MKIALSPQVCSPNSLQSGSSFQPYASLYEQHTHTRGSIVRSNHDHAIGQARLFHDTSVDPFVVELKLQANVGVIFVVFFSEDCAVGCNLPSFARSGCEENLHQGAKDLLAIAGRREDKVTDTNDVAVGRVRVPERAVYDSRVENDRGFAGR